MDSKLVYIGTDSSFYKSVCDYADKVGLCCHFVSDMTHCPPVESATGYILVIEADYLLHKAPIHPPLVHQSLAIVLVLEPNCNISLYSKTLCFPSFTDIWQKTDNPAILNQRIRLLHGISKQSPETEGPSVAHLRKQNHEMTCRIENLQAQLSQADHEVRLQEMVIQKIDQISRLSRQINSLNLKQIATVCTEKLPDLISARFASIYSYDLKSHRLELMDHNHPYTIDEFVALNDHPESPMAMAVVKKHILLIEDLSSWTDEDRHELELPFNRNYETNSCIIAPLLSGGEVTGVLNLADKIDGGVFRAAVDLPPIQLLSEIIGSAMANIRLYEAVQKQAVTDGLTGLLNHRTFFDLLSKEVHRAKRYGSRLSLLMIDVDNLKQVNDQLGHQAGDTALLHISQTISACIRDTDMASRYGGDEFAVILPNTSLSDALVVAQRLIRTIDDDSDILGQGGVRVSISVGLSQFQNNLSAEQFAKQADIALIEAKQAGKNRIHISEGARV